MENFDRPRFITFEGVEGSGKSTQSRKLYEYLLAKGIRAIHTREIGGTPEAEKIRDIVVHRELYTVSELMLIMAARYEHIHKLIVPALQDGYMVICDRFIDSTICYQSQSESGSAVISPEDIFALHNKLMLDPQGKVVMPDLTFFMDLPPENGLARSLKSGEVNKFEEKRMHFHRKVYESFQEIARLDPERVKVIDCREQGVESVHQKILSYL